MENISKKKQSIYRKKNIKKNDTKKDINVEDISEASALKTDRGIEDNEKTV